MEKYVKIYSFQVMDKLCEGKEIYCIDRGLKCIDKVSMLPVRALANILIECDMKEYIDRFEFYYVEEEGENNAETI